MTRKIVALVLVAVLTLSLMTGCTKKNAPVKSDYNGTELKEPVKFSEMKAEKYDPSYLEGLREDITKLMAESGNDEAIKADYEAALTEFDALYTSWALYDIAYYQDYNNEEARDTSNEMDTLFSKQLDAFYATMRELLKSDYGSMMIEYIDNEEFTDYLIDYEDTPDEVFDLMDEMNELYNQYNEVTNDESISGDETATKCAEIYLKLLDCMIGIASYDEDYESYVDMVYDDSFNRDYTVEDSENLHEFVKEYIVPVYNDLAWYLYGDMYTEFSNLYADSYYSEDEIVETVGGIVTEIGEDCTNAFKFLKDYELYDISESDTKLDAGFTIDVPLYGSSFIFNSPNGSYSDMETLIHEFGHFYAAHQNTGHVVLSGDNLDVAEIHSQGLEVLMLERAGEIFGEDNAELIRTALVMDMVSAIIDGNVYDEFQTKALRQRMDGTLTEPQQVIDLFIETENDYGTLLTWGELWYYVPHTFDTPFYYISYATSALAALEILAVAEEDRQAGIDLYNVLVHAGFDTGFKETLENCGMRDVFTEEGIIEVAEGVRSLCGDILRYTDEIAA